MRRLSLVCAAIAACGVRIACAEPVVPGPPMLLPGSTMFVPGSTAFCLYEIPADEPGKRRWINLGIVQYIEATRTELKIYFGGGSLGSGHEAKIPYAGMDEAAAIMEKLRKTAAACR